jgi:hypothetical protein
MFADYFTLALLVAGYCFGVLSYNAFHAIATMFWSIVLPIWVLIISYSSTRIPCYGGSILSEEKLGWIFAYQYHYIP